MTHDVRRTTPRVWHKLPTGELKKLKAKFGAFEANLTLKIKVKVTSFQTRPRSLYMINNIWFKFEDKIQNTSKLSCSQGITQTTTTQTTEPKTISPLGGGGDIIKVRLWSGPMYSLIY